MVAASNNLFPKVILEEVANDGSATVTPVADHRALFVGEDGLIHLKDSAAAVTTLGADTLPVTIIDAAGDLIIGSAADTAARLARGTDGHVLRSTATTVAWEADYSGIGFVIDGGGSAITTGNKNGFRYFGPTGVIEEVTVGLDQSGSIVIDVWKDVHANYPPTVADTITASAKPTVTTATNSTDTTLTGWTTTITQGDWLFFNVDSITTTTRASINFKIRKT